MIGIDASSKRQLALDSGTEHFISISDHDDKSLVAEVQKLTGALGVSAVLVCTASNKAYAQAMGMLRFGGTLVCVRMPEGGPNGIETSFPAVMVARMFTITSVAVENRREASEVLQFAARGVVETKVRVEKMEALEGVFAELTEGKLMGRVVLDLS